MSNLSCVLTIAGTDPSGGAGIQADIRAISATGAYPASVITALVAQNTQKVQAVQDVSVDFIRKQCAAVFSDLEIKAIKIGMLANGKIIRAIAALLKKSTMPIVLDPVMLAKNGSLLLSLDAVTVLKNTLLPLVDLLTPNLFEAETLLEKKIRTHKQMEHAAQTLAAQYQTHVLMKGGHLKSANACDVLCGHTLKKPMWFSSKRISTKNTHGTGCTLSAAIASYLAQGFPLEKAIMLAKKYTYNAIVAARTLKIGHGSGPLHHFYFLKSEDL